MKQSALFDDAKNNGVAQNTAKGITSIAKAIAKKKSLLKYLEPGFEPNEPIKLNFGDNEELKLEEKDNDDDDDEEANDEEENEDDEDDDDDEG